MVETTTVRKRQSNDNNEFEAILGGFLNSIFSGRGIKEKTLKYLLNKIVKKTVKNTAAEVVKEGDANSDLLDKFVTKLLDKFEHRVDMINKWSERYNQIEKKMRYRYSSQQPQKQNNSVQSNMTKQPKEERAPGSAINLEILFNGKNYYNLEVPDGLSLEVIRSGNEYAYSITKDGKLVTDNCLEKVGYKGGGYSRNYDYEENLIDCWVMPDKNVYNEQEIKTIIDFYLRMDKDGKLSEKDFTKLENAYREQHLQNANRTDSNRVNASVPNQKEIVEGKVVSDIEEARKDILDLKVTKGVVINLPNGMTLEVIAGFQNKNSFCYHIKESDTDKRCYTDIHRAGYKVANSLSSFSLSGEGKFKNASVAIAYTPGSRLEEYSEADIMTILDYAYRMDKDGKLSEKDFSELKLKNVNNKLKEHNYKGNENNNNNDKGGGLASSRIGEIREKGKDPNYMSNYDVSKLLKELKSRIGKE